MTRKNIIIIFFIFLLLFAQTTPKAKAYWGVADFNIMDIPKYIVSQFQNIGTWANQAVNYLGWTDTLVNRYVLPVVKLAALYGTQELTNAMLGTGSGKAPYVSNWNQYLYLSPQQRAMTYMSSLFNSSTAGRASKLNYEGIGQNNDIRLMARAQAYLSPKPLIVNLRDYAKNPDNVFDQATSFRGFNAYLNCPNNSTCINLIASSAFAKESEKQKTLAEKETVNGFLPNKKNGRIVAPAALILNAFSGLDKMGTDTITNAQTVGDVATGSLVRIAGAAAQAAFGTEQTQAAARQADSATTNKSMSNIFNKEANAAIKEIKSTETYNNMKNSVNDFVKN